MIGPAILFCPGDRPDRFAKAAARADAVILDLEDAVAPEDKPAARASVLDALPSLDPARTIVRINALDSPWGHDDAGALRALAAPPLVMLPKARAAADLDALAPLAVIALCETAEGVLAAPSIARAATCAGLMWGSEDLVADLGGRPGRGPDGRYRAVLEHARSTVLLAAAAAGRPAIDTVLVDLDDLDTLRADAEYAAAAGFTAKACVHPDQVDPVRAAFAATPAEVEWATGVLRAAEGRAGVFRHRGRMIDAPVLAAARAVLARRPSR
jgi:citrate lyase subunit beta/citryl-CoA lyase